MTSVVGSGGSAPVEVVVSDLWYTLICAEDHGGTVVGKTTPNLASALGIELDPFVAYWDRVQDERYRSPVSVSELVRQYMESLGQAAAEIGTSVDLTWQWCDQALLRPARGVVEALESVKGMGVRLGLLSNAHEREVREWQASPLAALFESACFSCEIGYVKPERMAYARVLGELGASADRAAFVGDGASGELVGAREAGFGRVVFMRGILADQGVSPSLLQEYASQADVTIDAVAELGEALGLGAD